MSKTKRPRKAHKPLPLINTFHAAFMRVAKLTDSKRLLLITPVWEAFDQLRRGDIPNEQFVHIADCINVAVALTKPGIGLLPDHVEKWHKAIDTIAGIAQRRCQGKSWTCHAHELAIIHEAIEFHDLQLRFASAHDVSRATKKVGNAIKGANSGSPGAFHIRAALPEAA